MDLKKKIAKRQLSIGSWLSLSEPAIAEILAGVGYEWLVVDLEHSVIGIESAGELIRTIDLCGVTPLVRLTSNKPDQIKRVMDAGAHGIIVPMVCSSEDAVRAVAATRYAPVGRRGVGLGRAQGYGNAFDRYVEWQQQGPIVLVQIEHVDALTRLKEILSVTGIDGLIIGPYDLSCSMGQPGKFDTPEFVEAIEVIKREGSEVGCAVGLHVVEPDPKLLQQAIDEGYNLIAHSVDIRILDGGARRALNMIQRRV